MTKKFYSTGPECSWNILGIIGSWKFALKLCLNLPWLSNLIMRYVWLLNITHCFQIYVFFSLSSKHLRNIFFCSILNFIQICSNSFSIIWFHQIFINFLLFWSISFVFIQFLHFSSILFNFNLCFVYFQLFFIDFV